MERSGISEGFHRVGIVIGVIVFVLGMGIGTIVQVSGESGGSVAPHALWPYFLFGILPAVVTYALIRAIGWIAAGFAGAN